MRRNNNQAKRQKRMLIFGWFIISFISKFKYTYICKFEKDIWKITYYPIVFIVQSYVVAEKDINELHMPTATFDSSTHYNFASITIVFYLTGWLTFDFDIYINTCIGKFDPIFHFLFFYFPIIIYYIYILSLHFFFFLIWYFICCSCCCILYLSHI